MLWPARLYTVAQCRELDRRAIVSGIDGYTLMTRAATSALTLLLSQWGLPKHIHVLCGSGNNGGDGLVLARLAQDKNLSVTVYLLGDASRIEGDARLAYQDALAAGVKITAFDHTMPLSDGVVVDALFGIGLNRNVNGDAKLAIDWVNQSGLPVLALDLPSGLCGDTGQILGAAIKADFTATFIAAKRGLYTGVGPEMSGTVVLDDLAIPQPVFEAIGESIAHSSLSELLSVLPERPRHAHKGLYGHVLIVGGNHGMAGAAMMAAESAARTGAGLTSVAMQPAYVNAMLARHPEVMAHGVASGQELEPLLEKPDVIVIGPGLGQTPWSEQLLQKVLATHKPLVLDADALNLLNLLPFAKGMKRDNWVLTPHPGEAARLLGLTTQEINADRFASVKALQQRFGGVVMLKGTGSLIATADETSLCSYGNPGMATGGMGDVLSGIIGSLLAQNVPAEQAVPLAVSLHAKAADLAANECGEPGLLATDLMTALRVLLNGTY